MKKSLLLAAAALLMSSSAFALDMYVVGADVNGASWTLKATDAKMTETSNGVYEWSGKTLGSKFKINDGTWDATYNIGQGDDGKIKLGTPYHYYMGDGSGDIEFDGFSLVNNPKIVLNMNAGTITLTGEAGEKEPVDPSDITYYIIGTNVNGASWALAQDDAKFTSVGNGIYKWEGKELGTGFKINDGTWSNGDYNIGSNGADIVIGEPYYYIADGNSGNIAFDAFTLLTNPVVELDVNEGTITLVSGEKSGLAQWYIMGLNNNWDFIADYELLPVEGEDGIFSNVIAVVEQTGAFKISDTGWAHEFGTNLPEENFISPDVLEVQLERVEGEGGNINYELAEGLYKVTFDYNEWYLTFTDSTGINTVVMGQEAEAVYYNLHGQKVANPDKGIFIKVVGNKAVKVVK